MKAGGARLAALLLVALLPSCSKFSGDGGKARRISLPGFSVELPAGKVRSTSKSPISGKHQVDLSSPGFTEMVFDKARSKPLVWVEWNTQSISRDDWKSLLMPVITQAIGSATQANTKIIKEVTVAPDRWFFVAGTPDEPMTMGVVNCEQTFSVMLIQFRYREVEREAAAMQSMIESVKCEVTDANRARPVAAIRLPAKFGRTPDSIVQTYQSLDGEQLIANFTRSDIQKNHQAYVALMRSMMSESFGIEIPDSAMTELPKAEPHPPGRSSLIRFKLGTAPDLVYLGTFYCPAIDLSLITLWYSPEASDQLARERQSQVGCPGEESVATPSFESLADEACRGGQKHFCGLKEIPKE